MQPVTEELAEYFGLDKAGVLISAVAEDPRLKAGLRRGDIILEYSKKKINDTQQLQDEVMNTKIGER